MKKVTKIKPVKIYCKECGREMFNFLSEAYSVKQLQGFMGDVWSERIDTKYDSKTGELNYVEIYQCPLYKRRFLLGSNNHDIIGFYKGEKIIPNNL